MLDSSPSEAGTQGVIADLQKVIDQAIQCVQAAAQRCIRLTQSAELGALIATADRCLATFIASLEVETPYLLLLSVSVIVVYRLVSINAPSRPLSRVS